MNARHASLKSFTDAAADAVAREIATFRRDMQRERDAFAAEIRAVRAEWEARLVAVSEIERRLADRLATLKDGEPGRDGADGKDGEPGRDGADGKDGRDGLDGKDGADGRDGAPGVDGRDGIDGQPGTDGRSVTIEEVEPLIRAEVERVLSTWDRPQDGRSVTVEDVTPMIYEVVASAISMLPPAKDGRDGVDGKDGAPGKMPVARAWADAVHYEGDVVTHDGSTYQAVRDTGKAPGHEDWLLLAGRGADGADGRSFTPRGTYSEGEIDTYRALDVVTLNGGSFYAKRDTPGACPGDGWQLMASQGKQGKPGERGVGMPGPPGQPGRPVVALKADDNGMLTLTNGDGSTVQCDLYPLLSRL